MVSQSLKRLLSFTQDKNIHEIYSLLVSEAVNTKGSLFENYICELYKGNGWLAAVQGGRDDAGADVLLYHPNSPDKVSLIIQAKNHKNKLSYDDTKIELVKFEEQAAKKYDCREFSLISLNGYVEKAKALADFNMALHDWNKVVKLIKSYDSKQKTPSLELLSHNEVTYLKIKSLFKTKNKISVVQATGTGKSYLIAQVLADNYPNHSIVLAPNHFILRQQSKILTGLKDGIKYITYAKSANLMHEYYEENKPTLIVLDEFHRAGATEWGKGVQRLLEACPDAKILGTSATHIRYLDNARNMADELFEGTIANEISLQEAIARQILPAPYYVSALYALDDEFNNLNEDINNCDRPTREKSEAKTELKSLHINWENTSGVPNLLEKHLDELSGKYIIFCESVEHMDILQDEVSRWFRLAAKKNESRISRIIYTIESTRSDVDNNAVLTSFNEAKVNDSVHLLLSVNMLNEGLHITDVKGVLLLRKTISPIIYFQQIGRCFHANSVHKPVIFDLVNNVNNIQAQTLKESIDSAIKQENIRRNNYGLENTAIEYHIYDETLELTKKLRQIEKRLGLDLDSFGKGLQMITDYIEEHGHCLVPQKYKTKEGYKLGVWVTHRRVEYKNNEPCLTRQRINQLEEIGFVWDHLEYEFQQGIQQLKIYINEHGHCRVPRKYKTENNINLGVWVSARRKEYQNKSPSLTHERISQLEHLGFIWDSREADFFQGYESLKHFKEDNGHCLVQATFVMNDGFKLGNWVMHRRKDYKDKNNYLTEKRINLLEEIGFVWDIFDEEFSTGLVELERYKEANGHCRVPQKYVTENGYNLGSWVAHRRRDKKENNRKLKEKYVEELNKLEFDWSPFDTNYKKGFRTLKKYKKEHGHCRVHPTYVAQDGYNLGQWVSDRRKDYEKKSKALTKDKIDELNKIGLEWNVFEADYQAGLQALKEFKKENGHCRVQQGYITPDGFKLGGWLANKRTHYKTNVASLTKEKIHELESLGVDWNPLESKYNKGLEELIKYKKENGHCRVPLKYVTKDGYQLGNWVSSRRQDYNRKSKALTQEKINELEKVGFEWKLIGKSGKN